MRRQGSGRGAFFVAVVAAASVLCLGQPLARSLGVEHWSDHGTERKLYWLRHSQKRPEILVLGSSRARHAFIPLEIETRLSRKLSRPATAFNAAVGNTGPVEASWFLEEIIRNNGCPRVVALDVNAEGLNEVSERLARNLRRYAGSGPSAADLIRMGRLRETNALLVGWVGGWGRVLRALAHPPDSPPSRAEAARVDRCRGGVWGLPDMTCESRRKPVLAQWSRDKERRRMARYRRYLTHSIRLPEFEIGGPPAAAVGRVADLTADCSAHLVLVTMPTLMPWKRWGWHEAVEATRHWSAEVAARAGVDHLDLTGLRARLGKRHFVDHGHLSRRGALLATRELIDLIEPRLAGGETSTTAPTEAPVPPAIRR